MASRKFKRTVEDFSCLHCGAQVAGDGYTNHCPQCLYSLHVDVFPGDRAEPCQGIMRPIAVEMRHQRHVIVHICQQCGERRQVVASDADDFEVLLRVSRESAEKS